ncbi:MAG: MFS transporter [Microbacterium sp.]|uniref:MFS transporter n=1 Tax=Microbacterium sp. TaxID=51671 RepID=UPI0039E545E6
MTNTTLDGGPGHVVNDARVNPRTGRPAGFAELALLLAGSCLSVLGAVLLAPVLPAMSEEFADVPGAEALVPLTLTLPALFIALLAPVAGRLVDKLGRKRVLIVALLGYAVVGTAPLWLDTLAGILASRALVGIAEAFIMTCCTASIADYFLGGRRVRYLGMQAVVTTGAATIFLALGGLLGASGWRAPFWLYTVSAVIALGVIVVIWPIRQTDDGRERNAEKLAPMRWRPLILPIVVSTAAGVIFYTLIVELSYVLAAHGVTSTATLGGLAAISSLATAIGSFLFHWVTALGARVLLAASLALAGIGYVVIMVAGAVPLVMAGAVIAGFGGGLLLPTLITWAISGLPYELRGRATGAWTSSIFFGEFLCPLIVAALTAATGSLGTAVGIVGVAALVIAALIAVLMRSPRPLVSETL